MFASAVSFVTGVYSPKSLMNPEILADQTCELSTSVNHDRKPGLVRSIMPASSPGPLDMIAVEFVVVFCTK